MRIMIATDGSDFSKYAVKKCCEMIVKPADTQVRIVSVYEHILPMAAEPFAVSAEYYQEIEKEIGKQAEDFAEQAAAQVRECFPAKTIDVSIQVERGAPDRVIIEAAKDWNADLIVVGSHGRGFWGRMMLGSISDSVLHHAPCSVMVVRKPA